MLFQSDAPEDEEQVLHNLTKPSSTDPTPVKTCMPKSSSKKIKVVPRSEIKPNIESAQNSVSNITINYNLNVKSLEQDPVTSTSEAKPNLSSTENRVSTAIKRPRSRPLSRIDTNKVQSYADLNQISHRDIANSPISGQDSAFKMHKNPYFELKNNSPKKSPAEVNRLVSFFKTDAENLRFNKRKESQVTFDSSKEKDSSPMAKTCPKQF